MRTSTRRLVALALGSVVAAGCSGTTSSAAKGAGAPAAGASLVARAAADTGPATLRLGYFPNITHAPALVGVGDGIFAKALGSQVTLTTSTYNAGGDASLALLSGAIDATFLGPSPVVSAFQKSHAITVVAGSTSGGAELVVGPAITTPAQLKGTKLATPQLGNTQDVALRYYLRTQHLSADTSGGGDVSILPQDNSTAVQAFAQHSIDGAWLPEPYASRLVAEGAHVLVDERSLWPAGRFATTVLAVRTDYLHAHPGVIRRLVSGLAQSEDLLASDPTRARTVLNAQLQVLTGKPLPAAVLTRALSELSFTLDPLTSTITQQAAHAQQVGLTKGGSLTGLVDDSIVDAVLAAAGKPAVAGGTS